MAKDYNPSQRNREAFEALTDTAGNVPPQAVELEEAVLGALMAQVDLGAGAIGGKDSMSGSFEDEAGELNVPPTLISFAVAVGKAARAVSPEFKGLTHRVVRIAPATYGEDYRPDAQQLLAAFDAVEALTATGDALAVSTPGYGCGAESLFKMCVGNQIGIELAEDVDVESLFTPLYGSFIVELAEDAELPEVADGVVVEPLGTTVEGYVIDTGSEVIELAELQEAWESGIEGVFAYRSAGETPEVEAIDFRAKDIHVYGDAKISRPRVMISCALSVQISRVCRRSPGISRRSRRPSFTSLSTCTETIPGLCPRIRQMSFAVLCSGLLARKSRMSSASGGRPVSLHSGVNIM